MSANDQWAKNSATRILKGATQVRATDGGYDEDVGEFDATNLKGDANAQGLLATEIGVDTVTTTLNVSVIVAKNDLVSYKAGVLLPSFSYVGDDGETHAGAFYILKRSKPIATKGGFKLTLSGKFTGVVSNQ